MMETTETKKNDQLTKAGSKKTWQFRGLVLVGIALFLIAWFLPWWTMDIDGFGYDQAQIRPWGLVITEKLASFKIMMKGTEMPTWFPTVMWAFLGVCLAALVIGAFTDGKKIKLGKIKFSLSQLLVGGVGLAYFIAPVFAAIYAGWRMQKAFGVALQGRTHIDFGDPFVTYVNTSLQTGWYLAFVAGIFLLVLAFMRDKLTGE